MGKLNRKAQYYIIFTILAGSVLVILSLTRYQIPGTWMMLVLSVLASLSLIFKVEGSTNHSHYNISFLVYAFALVNLGPDKTILVILISNLAEWAWYKYSWFIPLFNAASLSLVIVVSQALFLLAQTLFPPSALSSVAAVLASLMLFTFLNHLMVGLVIWFTGQGSISESGVFEIFPLMFDFTLMTMGAGTAMLWSLNPYSVVLTLLPLYLIYSTSKVPALERQTEMDVKTGVYNASFFNQALENELKRAHRFDRPLTVVMADLDLLRNINNTYGHLAGDEVLIGVATILKTSVREYDVVARFGGEEFVLLMPEATPEEVFERVESIRKKIEQAEYTVQTSVTPIKATMSFGIAGRQESGQNARQIIHNADAALYHSKLKGRNRVYIYTDRGYMELFKSGEPREQAAADESAYPDPGPAPAAPIQDDEPDAGDLDAGVDRKLMHAQPNSRAAGAVQIITRRFSPEQLVGWMLLVAVSLMALTTPFSYLPNWWGLGLFVALVALTEWFSIDIYVRETSVSTSAAPLIAGFLMFGPLGVVILSLVLAGVAMFKHGSRLRNFLFEAGNHTIAGLLCVAMIAHIGKPFTALATWQQLLVSLAASLVIFLSTTLLTALAMTVEHDTSAREVWKIKFSWLSLYYLWMGVLAFGLVLCIDTFGPLGILVIIGPLSMLRAGQMQYIKRTRTMVKELNEKNLALQHSAGEISRLNEGLLNTLAEVVELRDPYVFGHSKQVARIAELLAKKMGLSQDQARLIHKAGLLHDVGKLGISEAILLKPGKLTDLEYNIIQQHTNIGAEILKSSHSLHDLIPVVYQHHEHYDGSGYPGGLKGSETSIEARIIAVADAVDAMASDRSYRSGRSLDDILTELTRCSGTQFDPQVVEGFVQLAGELGPELINRRLKKVELILDDNQSVRCEVNKPAQ